MKLRGLLLASPVLFAGFPALADDAAILSRLDAMQKMIETQQREIQSQKSEIAELRHALSRDGKTREPVARPALAAQATPSPPALQQELAEHDTKIAALNDRLEVEENAAKIAKQEQPVWSFAGGRPTLSSADGRFSLSLRLLGQFDAAYYMQSSDARRLAAANGPDLSSGANIRRAQLGFQGKLFGDWSYLFNTEFGGSNGTESQGRIQALYVQYDGLPDLAMRVGAFPAPAGLEDNTGSADTIFLERAAPSDILRNAVAGDGRDAATLTYASDTFYAAASLTGARVADSAVFDEQGAVLARVADSLYADRNARIVVSASGAWQFRPADANPLPNSARPVTLSASPELTVDSNGTRLVSTGAINTQDLMIWGVEGAALWQNLYAQAGYFNYAIRRRASALSNPDFDGWYAQASFILTGEFRGYSTANAAFTAPKPREDFSLAGRGWGAWELAARYSEVNLNSNAGALFQPTPAGGIRGGEQKIWTAGLNWYPNAVLRFALDWQWVDVSRIGDVPASGSQPAIPNAAVGQSFNAVSLRSQLAL